MGITSVASLLLQKKCMKNCKLTIHKRQSAFDEFREKANVRAIKVIRLHLNPSKFLRNKYAWSRAVVGEPIFALPPDYITGCLRLPIIFYDDIKLNITESKAGCLQKSSPICRQLIIFQTLVDFTQVNKCNKETCDTICSRGRFKYFSPNSLTPNYSCCNIDGFHSNFTDFSSCIKAIPANPFIRLDVAISIVSILALIPLYIFIARCYIHWQGR